MHRRLLGLLALGLSLAVLAGCEGATSTTVKPEEQTAINVLNNDRYVNGVALVGENPTLTLKAQQWSDYLAQRAGGQCSDATLMHSTLSSGVPAGWTALGENVGCRTTNDAVINNVWPLETQFMNSSGHRANILDPRYNSIGIGLAWYPAATPGYWVIYETQVFAAL